MSDADHVAGSGQSAVVVGGGTMGVGIAHALLLAGFDVVLVETSATLASRAVDHVHRRLEATAERGNLTAPAAAGLAAHLRGTTSLGEVHGPLGLAIEAVPEDLSLKRDVLATMERLEPTVLATNTSALSIDELARVLERPERFLGMHFFNPVWSMLLVEVVMGSATSGSTRDEAVALTVRLGKEPIVVRDVPGFATSRLGLALGLEAMRMLEDGVASADDIDRAMVLGYRHPVGPLRLSDIIGLDVRLAIARNLAAAYGPRFEPPSILVRLVDQGRLGKKCGHGIYEWPEPGHRAAPGGSTSWQGTASAK